MFTARTGEPVELEKWRWIAHYENDQLLQFDEATGRFHNFDEIETDRLVAFAMTNGVRTLTVPIPDGATPVHFYDNIIQNPMNGEPVRHRLYGFGYKYSKSKQRLWMILPNDFIVETDDQSKIGVI